MTPTDERLLRRLRDVVGRAHVLVDPDLTQRYRTDWTGRFDAPPVPVVRPGDAAETAAVVEVCAPEGIAIVPQGGNTGLVGGGVPLSGEVVLSVERLSAIDDVDAVSGRVTAGAGARLGEVQRAAADRGWLYPVDLASRDTATIGGTVATNAGGLHVLRHGDTRRQLVGVEFVSGTGTVVSSLASTLVDNRGYHLPSLLCGSEGTLGIITRVQLRLVPPPRHLTTMLVRFDDDRSAAAGAESLRRHLPGVEAVELFFAAGMQLVCDVFGVAPPFGVPDGGYVIAETEADPGEAEELQSVVAALAGVADVAVATDSARRAALWRYRELHPEAIATVGVPHKLDVAVPPGSLADFVGAVPHAVDAVAPGARTWLFGHGGVSAVHVNVTGPPGDDDRVDDAVLELVLAMHGSISAEHGIGRAKRRWVPHIRGAAERQLLAELKRAFDPSGILNPHVLLS